MDTNVILERLISIRDNARNRAAKEANGNYECYNQAKVLLLENGIDTLIIEIQNKIWTESRLEDNKYAL